MGKKNKGKILITGATGFIGRYFIHKLIERGCWPVALVSEGREGIFPLDMQVTTSISPEILGDIDVVYHFAGVKGVDRCRRHIEEAISGNLSLTQKLVKSAVQLGVRIIFASTYWVYGHRANVPYLEDHILMPSEPYGWTKALAEEVIMNSGLSYAILRLSNVFGYGTGQGYDEMVSVFLKKALAGDKLVLQNGGNHCIDLIGIDDVYRALLMLSDLSEGKIVVNVGSGIPMTVLQVAEAVNYVSEKISGNKAEIIRSYEKRDEILFADRWVDIGRLKGLTGYSATPFELSVEDFAKQLYRRDI